MAIVCYEKYATRTTVPGASFDTTYVVQGASDTSDAIQAVYDTSPPAVVSGAQMLFRRPFKITEKGSGLYYADVTWEPGQQSDEEEEDNPQPLAFKINWDTSAETTKVTKSLKVISSGSIEGPEDKSCAIGWDGKKVQGCDQFIPTLSESIDIYYDPRVVTQDKVIAWNHGTGKVNIEPWLGFKAGEALMLGNTGEQTFSMLNGRATKPVPVTWKFKWSENITNYELVAGAENQNLIVPEKDGWDYLDVMYAERIIGNAPNQINIAVPIRFKVHRIYKRTNFRQLTGIG